jgi:hypothetical protein
LFASVGTRPQHIRPRPHDAHRTPRPASVTSTPLWTRAFSGMAGGAEHSAPSSDAARRGLSPSKCLPAFADQGGLQRGLTLRRHCPRTACPSWGEASEGPSSCRSWIGENCWNLMTYAVTRAGREGSRYRSSFQCESLQRNLECFDFRGDRHTKIRSRSNRINEPRPEPA